MSEEINNLHPASNGLDPEREPNKGEHMETETNGKGQIYGLLGQILKQVRAVGKGRSNVEQGYKFRGIDDVYEAVHPLFAEHGVFTVPRILSEQTTERTTAKGTILRFVNVTMAYDFFAPDGSSVTAEMIGEAMDAGDKASNKAMSAAHKYALIQTLCIPTGSTPDADYNTPEEIVGAARPTSKSSTAPEKCNKCGGDMWDNREGKRNPKAPDYKCKNKACDGAIWLKDDEPKTGGFSQDAVLRDQLFLQAEKLLAKLPEDKRKDALGRLLMLDTEKMGKKVLELAETAKAKNKPNAESEAQRKIQQIEQDVEETVIQGYLAEKFNGARLSDLSLDALIQMYEDVYIPF